MTETSIEKYAEMPHKLVEQMRKTGDLHEGFRFVRFIGEVKSKLDSTLDIVLPVMEEIFDENPPEEYRGMSFVEATVRATDLSADTIKNHTRVGRMLEVAPEGVRTTIENMPFRAKIQIADTVENGWNLNQSVVDVVTNESKSGWQAIADAYYPQEVALTLHEIKGTQPRSQFCKWEAEEDTIYAVTDIGRIPIAQRVTYDNPEAEGKAEWAWGKMLRKLDIYSRREK